MMVRLGLPFLSVFHHVVNSTPLPLTNLVRGERANLVCVYVRGGCMCVWPVCGQCVYCVVCCMACVWSVCVCACGEQHPPPAHEIVARGAYQLGVYVVWCVCGVMCVCGVAYVCAYISVCVCAWCGV